LVDVVANGYCIYVALSHIHVYPRALYALSSFEDGKSYAPGM